MREAQRFSAADLGRIAPHWDRAVDGTPDVDEFCASSVWSFSAATSFPEVAAPVIVGDGRAFCGLRSTTAVDGARFLLGLDPIWGFATPLVGPPMEAARMLASRLSLEQFDVAVVAGQREDSVLTSCVARVLGSDYGLYQGPIESRLRIDLSGGVDAWLTRRTPRFRQRLRRLRADGDARGLGVVDVSAMPPDDVFGRILEIEESSWKGPAETGLNSPTLASFYRQICARLAAGEQLRVLIAILDGRDVGFIFGGVRARTYRGLQLSYDRSVPEMGIGHLLQMAQIERLVTEGIETYDLGMDMEYKRRWADRADTTMTVLVRR